MITSDTLRRIVEDLGETASAAGLTRQRGGNARGIHWVELCGRGRDAAWYELRLHDRPDQGPMISAGMLAYQPLSQGGRTIVLGEARQHRADADVLVGEIRGWLAKVKR